MTEDDKLSTFSFQSTQATVQNMELLQDQEFSLLGKRSSDEDQDDLTFRLLKKTKISD